MPPRLFDPLRCLRGWFVDVSLDAHGRPVLRFDSRHTLENRQNAQAVARRYESLLRLQLERNGASVQKLMALGVLRLEAGRYVKCNMRND